MRSRFLFLVSSFLFLVSCGASATFSDDVPTGALPVVSRLDPAAGPAGAQVTIYGLGFSYVAETNVVTIGDEAVSAENYSILENPSGDEVETLTFTVPVGLAAGGYPVVVVVHDTASNSDVTFQVTP